MTTPPADALYSHHLGLPEIESADQARAWVLRVARKRGAPSPFPGFSGQALAAVNPPEPTHHSDRKTARKAGKGAPSRSVGAPVRRAESPLKTCENPQVEAQRPARPSGRVPLRVWCYLQTEGRCLAGQQLYDRIIAGREPYPPGCVTKGKRVWVVSVQSKPNHA